MRRYCPLPQTQLARAEHLRANNADILTKAVARARRDSLDCVLLSVLASYRGPEALDVALDYPTKVGVSILFVPE